MKAAQKFLLLALLAFIFHVFATNGQAEPSVLTAYVSWNPNGEYLAIAIDEQIDVIDAETRELVHRFTDTSYASEAPLWSPDGEMLGIGTRGQFEIWSNLATDPTQVKLWEDTWVLASAWSPEGQIIAVSIGEYVKFLDVASNGLIQRYNGEYLGTVHSLAWNADGSKILIGGDEVHILNYEDLNPEMSFSLESSINRQGYWFNPSAMAVSWSPSEEAIAIGSEDTMQVVQLADYENEPNPRFRLPYGVWFYCCHIGTVYDVEWHSSGQYIASSGADGMIHIWDVVSGEEIHQIVLPENTIIRSLAWSPDGSQLAYGDPSGEAKVVIVEAEDILPNLP